MDTFKLLDNMKKLSSLDTTLNHCLLNIKQKLNDEKPNKNECIIVGSVAEGCSLARWFHPDSARHEIEVDMVHIGGTFLARDTNLIDIIHEKPNYLRIRLNKDILSARCGINEQGYMHTLHGLYVNPRTVRMYSGKLSNFLDHDSTTKQVISALFGVPMCDIAVNKEETIKGTSFALKLILSDELGKVVARVSVDNVPAFRWHTWPELAADFRARMSRYNSDRLPKWPSQEIRQHIMQDGCKVVPKSSPFGGDRTTEWRWSFSCTETKLMNELSAAQKQTYFLAKIMFYKYIKPIDDDAIHLYWAKTTMLWICEDFPSDHSIWAERNIMDSLRLFFVELRKMFSVWHLPNFFIPKHSMLDYSDQSKLQQPIINRIDEMILNINGYVPSDSDFQRVFELIEPQRRALIRASRFLDQTNDIVDISMQGLSWFGRYAGLHSLLAGFWDDTDKFWGYQGKVNYL